MNSEQLQFIQKLLQREAIREIKKPMIDFEKLGELVPILESVETLRRKAWHEERFGAYEAMADEALKHYGEFAADYIPF